MLAVVPVKIFGQGKQRLAPLLNADERAGLSLAMVRDVLCALRDTTVIDRVIVISAEPMAELAEFGVETVLERDLGGGDLNTLVAALADSLRRDGAHEMLVAHGDLPLLQPADVSAVANGLLDADVSIAPDAVRDGSNLLAWRLDSGFRPAYGCGSFQRHCSQANERGLRIAVCAQPSARWDIDKPADLLTLLSVAPRDRARHTHEFLRASGLGTRLTTGRPVDALAGAVTHVA